MKVIICGAGRVGYGIAERLSEEGNDVSVIDTQPSLISAITETLDVSGVVGHGAHPEVLAKATNDMHAKLLTKIGADRVVLPEKDMGVRVAHNLVSANIYFYSKVIL